MIEKKRGLGRGLDALFSDARKEEEAFQPKMKRADEMVAAVQQIQAQQANNAGQRKLAVEKLTPGKFQPRRFFDDAALEQLAESIAVHGVLQPILVRPLSDSMFEIIAGERRWRAAQKAQVHEVPVVVQEMNDKEALEIALIENLQREDLSAVEEAEGYQRLMDEFGHTQDALATQLGKSRSHVANTMRLLKLPASVRKMVQNGSLTAGHARALINAKNPEELADLVQRRGLNVRQIEALVQKSADGKLKPKKQKSFIQKDVDVLALERLTSDKLGLSVTIDSQGASGRLTIEYRSLDQLDDLLARLGQTPRR
ncbi:MAG TPA: ParB/RepB/Spo0J family partition protein [Patescibacteria group bacterium]|nr:ParB/RepB/Spo0J family partition protein [Patescibacteria group bacterium]